MIPIFMLCSNVFAQFQNPIRTVETFNCDFCLCSQGISPLDFTGKGIRIDPRYLVLDREVEGSKVLDHSHGGYEKHFTLQVSGIYPVGKKFSVIGIVPYSIREGREEVDEPVVHTSGIGDAMLFGRYLALEVRTEKNVLLLSAEAGIKFPTGSSSKRDSDGELIDPHLQVGTGSTDFLVGGNLLFAHHRFSAIGNFLAGITTTGKTGYRFGNNLNYDVSAKYRLLQSGAGMNMLFASAGIRGEWRGRERQDGEVLANTGGNTTYLAAGLSFFFTPYFNIEMQYQHPILYALHGTQHAESYRITSGVQFIFY